MADDPPHLLRRTRGRIDVRTPQPGGEQVPAAEHVERQIAVAIVVAVKEAAFLVAVQRIVGGVQVEDDLLRRPAMGIKEQVDEQPLDRVAVVADLVIAGRPSRAAPAPAGSTWTCRRAVRNGIDVR